MDVEQADENRDAVEEDRRGERHDGDGSRIDTDDHEEPDQVVDDNDGEEECAQAIGDTRPDDREQTERERCVGRHRGAPAVRGRSTGVEGEIYADGGRRAADAGKQRQQDASPLAELAEIELPACF